MSLSAFQAGGTVSCSVHVSNVMGAGPESAPVSFTVGAPVAPTGFTAVPDGQGHVIFNWTPVPDTYPQNGGFHILAQRVTCTSGAVVVVKSVPAGVASYGAGLSQYNGSTFTCSVHDENVVGSSPESNTSTFTTS